MWSVLTVYNYIHRCGVFSISSISPVCLLCLFFQSFSFPHCLSNPYALIFVFLSLIIPLLSRCLFSHLSDVMLYLHLAFPVSSLSLLYLPNTSFFLSSFSVLPSVSPLSSSISPWCLYIYCLPVISHCLPHCRPPIQNSPLCPVLHLSYLSLFWVFSVSPYISS